jgi:hypothetical protein
MLAGMPEDEESSGGDEDGEAGAADDHAMEDASLQAFEGHGGVQTHAPWQHSVSCQYTGNWAL